MSPTNRHRPSGRWRFRFLITHYTRNPMTSEKKTLSTATPEMASLRERSGTVRTDDPLTSFLYDLLRDHLPAGTVERLVNDAHVPVNFSNGWLACYATDVAARLRVGERDVVVPCDPAPDTDVAVLRQEKARSRATLALILREANLPTDGDLTILGYKARLTYIRSAAGAALDGWNPSPAASPAPVPVSQEMHAAAAKTLADIGTAVTGVYVQMASWRTLSQVVDKVIRLVDDHKNDPVANQPTPWAGMSDEGLGRKWARDYGFRHCPWSSADTRGGWCSTKSTKPVELRTRPGMSYTLPDEIWRVLDRSGDLNNTERWFDGSYGSGAYAALGAALRQIYIAAPLPKV